MGQVEKVFLPLGVYSFLLGVALLIVRQNSYPWAVKRASDILFLVAFAAAAALLWRTGKWRGFLASARKPLWGLSLILAGLTVASLAHYIVTATPVDKDGVLAFGRFVEAGAILLLVGIFQRHDVGFYKKVAVAQLSTILYAIAFVVPASVPASMYRFQLFENWPSNVGYYLMVSATFVAVLVLSAAGPLRFVLPSVALTAFLGLLLWTQARAAWLATAVSLILIFILHVPKLPSHWVTRVRNLVGWPVVFSSFALIGFLLLPSVTKNLVIARVFPRVFQTLGGYNIAHTTALDLAKHIKDQNLPLTLKDPERLALWKAYAQKIAREPLGGGVNYGPLNIRGYGPQGPHNTLMETYIMAGPLGFFGFCYLLFLAFRTTISAFRSAPDYRWPMYLLGALAGFVIVSLFDNLSTFRLLWLVLGTAIFLPTDRENGGATNGV